MPENAERPVTVVGHALVPTGRGEDARGVFRAFQRTGGHASICDVPCGPILNDDDIVHEIGPRLTAGPGPRFNIFVINGADVDWVLRRLDGMGRPGQAVNVISPQWELSNYPDEWARRLERFDEVWAPTRFVSDALRKAVRVPVRHLPYPVDFKLKSPLGRRYFRLPEAGFLFMFLFDFGSFVQRKNPFSVIEAFRLACQKAPRADWHLVIKMSGHNGGPAVQPLLARFVGEVLGGPFSERIIVIGKILTDNETKNLIRCSDCFVSLHRSEGLGRGPAEAMLLGKPVIATAYSGNLDFMDHDNSCLVGYELIPVPDGSYLFPQGQVWADPDIEQAAHFMVKLYNDPDLCLRLGRLGSRRIRTCYSHVAVGLKYRSRIDELCRNREKGERS